jgi:hypothetical protein
MPDTAVDRSNYYANLDFWSFYPDGQRAGVTTAKLSIANSKKSEVPRAAARMLTPYLTTGSKYRVVAKFNNVGYTHFTPIKCKAAITDLTSEIPRLSAMLTSGQVRGYMLPFESREFYGDLDLSWLAPGDYNLSVALQYDRELPWVEKQHRIRITLEGQRRVLETIGTEEDLPQKAKVKWE